MRLRLPCLKNDALIAATLGLFGCTSNSVTTVESGGSTGSGGGPQTSSVTAGGKSAASHVGGTTDAVGGAANASSRSTAPVNEGGTASVESGGASGVGGMGGVGGVSGVTAPQSSAQGGSSSIVSTLPPGACRNPSDCTNPDPYSCATPVCDNGQCRSYLVNNFTTDVCSAAACAQSVTDGFFGPNDEPFVVYDERTQSGPVLRIQKINGASGDNGGAVTFALPVDIEQPTRLAVAMNGDRLGILFSADQFDSYRFKTTQFAVTDLSGIAATPAMMSRNEVRGEVVMEAYQLVAIARPNNDWLVAQFALNADPYWMANAGAASKPPGFSNLDPGADWVSTDHAGFALVDDVILTTGHDCRSYRNEAYCKPRLLVHRNSASDLASLGGAADLGDVTYSAIAADPVAITTLTSGDVAIAWNTRSDGSNRMGTARVRKDLTIATGPSFVSTRLIPKALVPLQTGGALLVASQLNNPATVRTTYTPVVQKLSSNLELVGSVHQLGETTEYDIRNVSAKLSHDGKHTLITYTRARQFVDYAAARRLIPTDLCE